MTEELKLLVVPLVAALMMAVKLLPPLQPEGRRWALPWISMVLGVAACWLLSEPLTRMVIFQGIVYGLAAAGLYDVAGKPTVAAITASRNGGSVLLLCGGLALASLGSGGCLGAGTAAELMSYDTIALAALEASRGVTALDAAVQADLAKNQVDLLKDLRESVVTAGGDPAQADRIVAAMKTHLANYSEQERRRRFVVETTQDNLEYILEVCEKGKEFTLYRSSISDQWKAYLSATAENKIKHLK